MFQLLSPYMLKTYESCPKKFEFQYVKNISMPTDDDLFSVGKNIHALASYYLKKQDISKMEASLDDKEQVMWKYLKNLEYFDYTVIDTEYSLSTKIKSIFFGGRLDALVKKDDIFYILDYKTGSVPQNPKYDYQTIIYLLCVSKFFKQKNISFVYIDLKNNQNHMINYDEELEKEYTQKITNICERIIKTQTFNNIQKCKFCEYRKIC